MIGLTSILKSSIQLFGFASLRTLAHLGSMVHCGTAEFGTSWKVLSCATRECWIGVTLKSKHTSLINSFPLSDWSIFGAPTPYFTISTVKHSATNCPSFRGIGNSHRNLLKQSITLNTYLNKISLKLKNNCDGHTEIRRGPNQSGLSNLSAISHWGNYTQ